MPSRRPTPLNNRYDPEEELYELNEDGTLPGPSYESYTAKYGDGRSIDWLREQSAERERIHAQSAHRGVRGLILNWLDSFTLWFVIVGTGIGIGLASAWLDVLVKWLGDLREGRCSTSIYYNQNTCCSSVDLVSGEVCREWQSWGEFFQLRHIFAVSLLQAFVYVLLAISFAGSASVLVTTYAPYAFHTGIPEIKAILGGYVFDAFLTPWTLLIKALGLALAVASGLSLGKEGPLVHVSCCMANLLARFVKLFRHNEAQKRKLLAAAAAAGVSVAFGSPLGGVLFGLEELDTFGNESDVMWKGFVASAVAAVALQYVDPFGTSKLVLFQVTETISGVSDTWRAFELIPWVSLGVIGGILGTLLIKLNVEIAVYRRNSVLNDWPVLEVVSVSAVTAAISYLVVFARVQSSELVANLFQECDPSTKADYHGLCNPNSLWENGFLLILTAALKFILTAWTFGMMIPAGIFLPTIAIGACLGRVVGLLTQGLQRTFMKSWLFQSCPPDPSVRCVSPGFYAVIGAAGMLGGVTRMTISLVVILFELTGALSHVLPIMICVMTSKFVGDAFSKDGIYSVWIAMRRYPWLDSREYHDHGENGSHVMKSANNLVVIEDEKWDITDLERLLKEKDFHGFPVVRDQALLGYATRERLSRELESLLSEGHEDIRASKCVFRNVRSLDGEEFVDLSKTLEEAVLQLRKEVPLEVVVRMFQKLNLRQILFTQAGKLEGMVTKRDIVSLVTMHFPHTAALTEPPPCD